MKKNELFAGIVCCTARAFLFIAILFAVQWSGQTLCFDSFGATCYALETPQKKDWCAGHGLPESKCTKCNPGLIESFKQAGDWCAGHGFPESVCPVCNPAMTPAFAVQGTSDWCAGHGLPESKCTKCNPGLIESFKQAGDWCADHGFPESVCPVCNPAKVPAEVPDTIDELQKTKVRFKSPETEKAAGIMVVPALAASMDAGVTCTARIAFNQNRLAEINARIPGIVSNVLVEAGQQVHMGDPLLVIESARMGDYQARLKAAKERLAAAQANHDREKSLFKSKISSAREVEEAGKELEAAHAEIQSLLGALRVAGEPAQQSTGKYIITAPFDGSVIRRSAAVGRLVTEADVLLAVADLSTMWVLLDVKEWDAALIRNGQKVAVRVDSLPGATLAGTVTWIASEVDPQTRSVMVRAEVPNTGGLLRANLFAQATVQVEAFEKSILIPREAVQQIDSRWIVFVKTADGVFEPRQVTLGRSKDSMIQVISGLRQGDPVVTTGAFLLKTEIAKESIGAGCCEIEQKGGAQDARQNP